METKVFYFNPLRECCYLLWDESGEAALIDPGCCGEREFLRLKEFVDENALRPVKVLLTHGHFDHIFGLRRCYEAWHPEVLINKADIGQVEHADETADFLGLELQRPSCTFSGISDGDKVSFGNTELTVIATPGHTEGSVCFYDEAGGRLFCGDTLFQGSVGRTDLPGGDFNALMESLRNRLATLPDPTEVFPGHGYPTTIGEEKASNPFMRQ